jgi:hypothetical protein
LDRRRDQGLDGTCAPKEDCAGHCEAAWALHSFRQTTRAAIGLASAAKQGCATALSRQNADHFRARAVALEVTDRDPMAASRPKGARWRAFPRRIRAASGLMRPQQTARLLDHLEGQAGPIGADPEGSAFNPS